MQRSLGLAIAVLLIVAAPGVAAGQEGDEVRMISRRRSPSFHSSQTPQIATENARASQPLRIGASALVVRRLADGAGDSVS